VGGTPEDNAEAALALLGGGGSPALREAICINAGAALYLFGRAADIMAGHQLALEALLSGETSRKLDLIKASASSFNREVVEDRQP
jgi:anthranilate phosphoribosyltransferase